MKPTPAVKSLRERLTEYAPEFGEAIAMMPSDFQAELEEAESTSAFGEVCEGFSVWWWIWHDGRRVYALGSCFNNVFGFRPRSDLTRETLTEDGEEFFHALCGAFHVPYDPYLTGE